MSVFVTISKVRKWESGEETCPFIFIKGKQTSGRHFQSTSIGLLDNLSQEFKFKKTISIASNILHLDQIKLSINLGISTSEQHCVSWN